MRNKTRQSFSTILLATAISYLAMGAAQAAGTNNQLSDAPLFLKANTKPNVVMGIDDSGSMDFEILFFSSDGQLHWDSVSQSFDGADDPGGAGTTNGVINFNESPATSGFHTYSYLFPNGFGAADGRANAEAYFAPVNIYSAVPPFAQFAYARSIDFNKGYYDPTVTYKKWRDSNDLNNAGVGAGTRAFSVANESATKYDPVYGNSTIDLEANKEWVSDGNAGQISQTTFKLLDGMVVPNGTRYYDNVAQLWKTTSAHVDIPADLPTGGFTGPSASIGYDWDISYYPSTYYRVITPATIQYQIKDGGTTRATINSCPATAADYDTFAQYPTISTIITGGADPVYGVTMTVDAIAPNGDCLQEVKIDSGTYTAFTAPATRTDCGGTCSYLQEIHNFANWFQYYRKRHMALRGAIGEAFYNQEKLYSATSRFPNTASYAINTIKMEDLDTATDRERFFDVMYDIGPFANPLGTENRFSLDGIGKEFQRANNANYTIPTGSGQIPNNGTTIASTPLIQESCQKNFALMFTDGFTDLFKAGISIPAPIDDEDGNDGVPYADSYADTIADVARYYYENNLRPGITPVGNVSVSPDCSLPSPDPKLDCETNLHLQTFGLVLNAKGNIFNQDQATSPIGSFCGQTFSNTTIVDTVAEVYACEPNWQDANTIAGPAQVDDLFHAAVNSHGDMFNASNANGLSTSIKNALNSIAAQSGFSAGNITLNTSAVSGQSLVYASRFDTTGWLGDVEAYQIITNISNGIKTFSLSPTPNWKASDVVPGFAARTIYTYGATDGVEFTAGNLANFSTALQNDLNTNLASTNCGGSPCTVSERIDFLRGDPSKEGPNQFRQRQTNLSGAPKVLGDFVNSGLVLVAKPQSNWPSFAPFPIATGKTYQEFFDLHLNREPLLYSGSNGGMLHGFRALDGQEQMAYIPSLIASTANNAGMHYLSEPGYQHRYYVDLTPSVQDAFFDTGDGQSDAWHTVLVGGLRNGGKGYFALDITDPTLYTNNAANISNVVMWEFSTTNSTYVDSSNNPVAVDNDIGQSFSEVTIAPTNILSNNNELRWAAVFGNGYESTNCNAVLYVAFLEGGIDGSWSGSNADNNSAIYSSTDYIRLTTDTVGSSGACNGLSSPVLADLDNNGTVDRVYAGDLYGRLWVFDLCDKNGSGQCNNSGNWQLAYNTHYFEALDDEGRTQSITVRPRLQFHPGVTLSNTNEPNILMAFGTGRYIEDSDIVGKTGCPAANPSCNAPVVTPTSLVNSFYVVWDTGSLPSNTPLSRKAPVAVPVPPVSGSGSFVRKTLTVDSTGFARETDVSTVGYTANGNNKQYGWFMDFDPLVANTFAEERVITNALIVQDIVFFATAIPTTTTCSNGGTGWFMFVDLQTGDPIPNLIDFNGDGVINASDQFTFNGTAGDASGVREDFFGGKGGIPDAPQNIGDQVVFKRRGTSQLDFRKAALNANQYLGRLNWHELRQD